MVAPGRFASDRGPTSTLPIAPTSFVGRLDEVEAARERLLRPDVRLLTFIGPGGAGKTRLAVEVATGLAATFVDGVHFVDLAPIRDPALVHATIAHTLGMSDAGDQPLFETLRHYLRTRTVLLVLDNFEQVIEAATLVSSLLATCPQLKIAVTSREPLHLSWEHEWPVHALPLPAPDSINRSDLIASSPAVTLFVERARAINPDFALTAENARVVADICVRLDGLPLAIELAAARVKLLPVTAIHARLHQRLLLLTGGRRDAPVRHHTLRAAVAWSYGLLNRGEKATFHRLAIFVGGFTIEAAQAVDPEEIPGDCIGGESASIVDRLQSLVDKNLLRAESIGDGEPRFRMLETIREFGLEQLSASGEFDQVQVRHARFFLTLAEQGEQYLLVRVEGTWLDRLDADHDNLRAALTWSLAVPGEVEFGARLATAMSLFWMQRGHFSIGRAWYDLILKRMDRATLTCRMLVRVHWAAAGLAWRQGDYDAASHLCNEGIDLADGVDGRSELASCLAYRGVIACYQARFAVAHAAFDRGLDVARDQEDHRMRAFILGFSSLLSCLEGQYSQARRFGEESLAILRERREVLGIALNLDTLGSVARRQGDYLRAQSLHEQSIAASQVIGDRWAIAISLANLGHVARALGDDPTANQRYSESLRIHRQLGDRRGIALALSNLGDLAERVGENDRASELLSESLAASRAVGDKRIMAGSVERLAGLALARGDVAEAATGLAESLRLLDELQDPRGVARALDGCASLLATTGRLRSATEMSVTADALLDSICARRSPADQAIHNNLKASFRGAVNSVTRLPALTQIVDRALSLIEPQPAQPRGQRRTVESDAGPLSRREQEIAIRIALGLTNRAIAEDLVIAERTADTHVSNILAKLSLENRSQIAAWAVVHRLPGT